jgi:hypothetical protein
MDRTRRPKPLIYQVSFEPETVQGEEAVGEADKRDGLLPAKWPIFVRILALSHYLAAQYHRIARRRGREKAIVAVSHSLLVIIYHVLREKQPYTDLGADYFDKLDTARIERHHVRRLEQLGYTVTLTPTHAA